MSNEEKTILISGAFNPLHIGHLLLLKDASNYGKVIVALNSDEWVMKNKGHLLFDFDTRVSNWLYRNFFLGFSLQFP